ncbi:hypothetical protein [Fodinicola acaciae]|uniref:hypothetical protein n=1 Tax=Fodinicola acaciae TaxID=2681555 RepID=UPI0013D34F6F|nr:hypothetical protein [Fodinicola acaciae]
MTANLSGGLMLSARPLASPATRLCMRMIAPAGFAVGVIGMFLTWSGLAILRPNQSGLGVGVLVVVVLLPIVGGAVGVVGAVATLAIRDKRSYAALSGSVLTARVFRTISIDLATAGVLRVEEVAILRGGTHTVLTAADDRHRIQLRMATGPHGLTASDFNALSSAVRTSPAAQAPAIAGWLHHQSQAQAARERAAMARRDAALANNPFFG